MKGKNIFHFLFEVIGGQWLFWNNKWGADTFFEKYFGRANTFIYDFFRKFFRNSHFLPFFKENCRNNVVSAVWIWRAETFFEDGNGGAMTFFQNWIGGAIRFLQSKLGGEGKEFFGPKNNGFPGWWAVEFWPLPYVNILGKLQ